MKSSQIKLLGLALFACCCLAVLSNTIWLNKEKKPFTIGTTRFNAHFQLDAEALEKEISREVLINYYDDEKALLKAIYERQLDAYILNPFNYIEHYKALDGARVIASFKSDYYLVSRIGDQNTPQNVAIIDDHLSALLINQRTIKYIYIPNPIERIAALSDALVDLIILESEYYDPAKHQIVDTVSNRGYDFNLFIVSSEWLEEGLLEKDQQIVPDLQMRLFQFSEGSLPDEEKLLRIMNYLFQNEIIKKRLDYNDLVYMNVQ